MTPREEARERLTELILTALSGAQQQGEQGDWPNDINEADDLLAALLACREDVLAVLGAEQVGWQWIDDGVGDGGLLDMATILRGDSRCLPVFRFASEGSQDA